MLNLRHTRCLLPAAYCLLRYYMTRETKIGLLVGLAFIIVIGILLSDHLTNSTEPPAATLAQTGSNVRQQVTTPGGTQAPISPTVQAPQVTPQTPVPTIRELQPQTPATAALSPGAIPKPWIATSPKRRSSARRSRRGLRTTSTSARASRA